MYFYFKGSDFTVEGNENGDLEIFGTTTALKSIMKNGFLGILMDSFSGKIFINPIE